MQEPHWPLYRDKPAYVCRTVILQTCRSDTQRHRCKQTACTSGAGPGSGMERKSIALFRHDETVLACPETPGFQTHHSPT